LNIVLLSGGSGKRLWPLSNDIRSKQFIPVFKTEDGTYESMIQRVYRQIHAVDPQSKVTIATSKSQIPLIHKQLGRQTSISVEPCRRDTFPAIALSAAYLRDVQNVSPEEAVVVCPVDPYVEHEYFEAIRMLGELAQGGTANLVLMGIEPTYPSEKYGYIIPETAERVSPVRSFKEKPEAETAKEYILRNALWNGGVFAFRLRYLLEKARELIGCASYRDLLKTYETLPKISFDYAVAEKEQSMAVMRFGGEWKDLGTWNTLTETMSDATFGNVICDETCVNSHVINELNTPILCMGIKDLVVAASPEGVIVSDKKRSSYIKPYVDGIEQQVMFSEKSWGSYRVVDVGEESLTIKITLQPGSRMTYHSHQRRDEIWIVIKGEGRVVQNGGERLIRPGDVIQIPALQKHTVIAETKLEMVEVQIGKEITVYDKQKHSFDK